MTKKQQEQEEQREYLAAQRQVNADIEKQSFQPFYLFYGEEPYLRAQNRDKMRTALADGAGDMNLLSVKGKDIDPQELVNFAETVPFFASRRTVFVEDSGFFKNGCEALENYFKIPPATCVFVFTETNVDRRSALYKRFSERGRIVNCVRLNEEMLRKWLADRMKSDGKTIRENAAQALLDRTGTEMLRIENERQKLLAFCEDREEITRKDVETICSAYLAGMIYEMTDAIAAKDRKRALEQYLKMLQLMEPPAKILYYITKQFRQLLLVSELIARGADAETVSREAGIRKFLYRKYADWCARFRIRDLQHCLDLCLAAERDFKSGRMDKQIAIETLIAQATMTQSA